MDKQTSKTKPLWAVVAIAPGSFRLAEWIDGRYVVHQYLPTHPTYEAAHGVLVGMGWASAKCPQSEEDYKQALREAREALNRNLAGRERTTQEVERLLGEYNRLSGLLRETLAERDAALTSVEAGYDREKNLRDEKRDLIKNYEEAFRKLERENETLREIMRQAGEALAEALTVVDEAFVATGYSKVASTSRQRLRLEEMVSSLVNR